MLAAVSQRGFLQLRIFNPRLRRDERHLIIDQHDRSQLQEFTDFTRRKHRYPNATMTGRLARNTEASVDGNAAADVIRIIHRSRHVVFPTNTFLVDDETAARRVSDTRLTVVEKFLSIAC